MEIFLVPFAFIMEVVDSSLGMLYGTVLSPALVLFGYDPKAVVPAILLSQAIGGLTAAASHHRHGNADFGGWGKEDMKVSVLISAMGIAATVGAALFAVRVPKNVMQTYIGTIVFLMGMVLLLRPRLKFSWRNMAVLGIWSAANKSLSGGGFGPLVTGGQVLSGRNARNSIGSTTLAEAPICIAGFLTYFFSGGIPDWKLVSYLSLGAALACTIGPRLTASFRSNDGLRYALGGITLLLGISVLVFGMRT